MSSSVSNSDQQGIDPVLIMRIPTMISGICFAAYCVVQIYRFSNVHLRFWFTAILGLAIITINAIFIFFAAIHCPQHLQVCEGKVSDLLNPASNCQIVANNCSGWI
mmetsp:Transcript_11352/g.25811  ORF Transcript_11352/g.25811 Transcript_11352/m.25811 type:complete len:106 (+) Transcript_11352:97-414(+)